MLIPKLKIPDDVEPDLELMGTVVKVTTTSGGKNLAHIEFDLEESKSIAEFWNKPVKVLFYNYVQPKHKEKNPIDDLFSDYDPFFD